MTSNSPEIVKIAFQNREKRQRWEGFGSSVLSWYEPHPEIPLFKNLQVEVRQEAMRLAYRDLGLTRARFFPRPFLPDHEWDQAQPTNWRQFLQLEAGDCDGYVATCLELQEYGLRDWYPCFQVDGRVAGGPPPWMRPGNNGRSLTPATNDLYIELLMLLTRHWRDRFGVEPSFWSLCNEPTYPPNRPLQISLDDMLYLVKTLGRKLRAEGFGTRIVMPDDWTPRHSTIAYAKKVLADEEARGYVAGVAFHGYDGYEKPYLDWRVFDVQRQDRVDLAEVCQYYNVPAWQTESTSIEPGKDAFDDALFQANHIHDDLTFANAAAWDYMWGIWQSDWRLESGWGVQSPVYVSFDGDGKPTDVSYTELGQIIGQWSRAVKPDAVRIATTSTDSEVRVTAFEQGADLIAIAINNRSVPVDAEIAVEGVSLGDVYQASGFATTEGASWLTFDVGRVDQQVAATLPARSVTTLVLTPQKPIIVGSTLPTAQLSVDITAAEQTVVGFGGTLFNWRESYWEVPRMANLPPDVEDEAMRLAHQELGFTVGRTFPRVFPEADSPVDFADPACDGIADTIRRSRTYGLDALFAGALIQTPSKTPVPQIPKAWLEPNGRTLSLAYFQPYADHVAAFLKHWRDDLGIDLMGWSLDRAPSSPPTLPQTLTPDAARLLTITLGRTLQAAGLQTRVLVASDAVPARHGIAFAREILADEEARQYVLAAEFSGRDGYQSAYYDWRYFDGQRRSRQEMADLCKLYGIPLWQTESLTVRPAMTPTDDAMFRANHIHDDLTFGNASVWLYRWLFWEGGWNENCGYQSWGPGAPVLVYFDDQNRPDRVTIAPCGAVMGQWARWIRPGARRVETRSTDPSVRVTGFTGPEVNKLVLVIINNHHVDVPVNVNLAGWKVNTLDAYRTSETEMGVTIAAPSLTGDQVAMQLKPQSVTTVVVHGRN